jgi:hypothetical protein
MDDLKLWNLVNDAWNALSLHFEPVIEKLDAEFDLEPRMWGMLLACLTFEPEDTTPAHLMIRNPYTAAEVFLERLSDIAGKNCLAEVARGRYRLTDLGQSIAQRFMVELRAAMVAVDPLPAEDSAKLATFASRLVERSLRTPPPPDTWSIGLSYKLMPELQPRLPYIEQAITCLAAYRDDAHLAAWRKTGLSATALEALTLLWRGEVNSFDTICERLAYRGHNCQVYINVLSELRNRGFIDWPEDLLKLTASGGSFRDQVESDTNHLFFAPWSCLSAAEKDEMSSLLTSLMKGLLIDNEQDILP